MTDINKNTTHEHYLTAAAAYDERIPAILPLSETFFASCLSFIPQGPVSILELGSGTGYATSLVLQTNPDAKITGIDHSPEMIRYAKLKPSLTGVTIVEKDIRDPWPDQKYEVILSTLCFHHIPLCDRIQLLNRIFQSLVEGGVFICGDIIRPKKVESEAVYRLRWLKTMETAGISQRDIDIIVQSREENYADMETIESFYTKLVNVGFNPVILPYKYDISAVFTGYR
jgi:trans-aconitate methyltransferase